MGTNTGIGIGIGIPFRNNALGGDNMYFPPELKARMIGVWDNYGKKNTDADRNIIKNKIPNAGGDLEILNSAYRLNSGFGGYSNDFQEYTYHENVVIKTDTNAVFNAGGQLLIPYSSLTKDVPSFKIKVSGLSNTYHFRYYYRDNNGVQHSVNMAKDGNYELPICYNVQNSSDGTDCGFANNGSDIVTVEILPAFEGALVTDGINDIIASIKTLEEWNIGDKGITIVSMIHQINTNTNNFITTNNIRTDNKVIGRNIVSNIEKTGIYGWYKENIQSDTINVINNILGDKNDYTSHSSPSTNINPINNSKFYVQGYAIENGFNEISSIAHYWTFAVLGKATEDEINLIIGNYNLDRSLKPDILCNIGKQGITNDNHADFNDKLVDYSGNGRDIQMNNLAWKGGSGIAAKPFETIKDYAILSDEARQKLTIYNEFSYKVKSNTPNHYWTVQSIIKDNTSYQVTIITDKDCYWINSTSFTNNEGNKESIRKEYPVKANTPTQVTICGLNEFEYPEGIEPTTAVSYVNLEYAGEITVTFIPSYKGGLLLDGVNDFGKVIGMPIYKDYTFIIDYERISYTSERWGGAIVSKSPSANNGAFISMMANSAGTNKQLFSFGGVTAFIKDDLSRILFWQTKYKSENTELTVGEGVDGDTLWLGTLRDNDSRFFNGAIYSLMSFPYSMSKFLIERQLKKHKLGTLYPDMVEFRPIVKSNLSYSSISYSVNPGEYISVDSMVTITVTLPNTSDKLMEVSCNAISDISISGDNGVYEITGKIVKSPQKINITIDEYIRYEDIVQPYPSLFTLIDYDTEEVYSWGSKLKVGARFKGNVVNLLPNMYEWQGDVLYNGEVLNWGINPGVVAKEMVFSWNMPFKYLIDNNEPKCILSPRLLRIPNSSYKILGYIPDISGHGNHGKINNSAYAEGSGVNEDGSYQFDGVDDSVTIPTTVGGKQVLMKVNWQSDVGAVTLYDQRLNISDYEFAIYNGTRDLDDNPVMAYQGRNNGQTYIDGILNSNIMASELKAITHNITITNELSLGINNTYPVIGSTRSNTHFTQMSLYDFMLFDDISTEDKIKELNKYVGIEAKVELPPYYWDTYGKTNSDADRNTIQQRGVAVGDYDLTNYNHAYEGMSGYNGYPIILSGTNRTYQDKASYVNVVGDDKNVINLTRISFNTAAIFSYVKQNGELTSYNKYIESFKIKVTGIDYSRFVIKYSYISEANATAKTTMTIASDGIYELPKSFASDGSLTSSDIWIGINFTKQSNDMPDIIEDVNVTIEVLPEYENGLAYDGVSDFTDNKNIPILTDFTFIIKREILGLETNESMLVIKGDKVYNNGIGNAFILEHNSNGVNYVYSYGKLNQIKLDDSKIIYLTPESYNGNPIIKGENGDNLGLVLSRHWRGIIYKTILYSKTISLLQINFLKNLMEKDEIIDLNNPIFIKNE